MISGSSRDSAIAWLAPLTIAPWAAFAAVLWLLQSDVSSILIAVAAGGIVLVANCAWHVDARRRLRVLDRLLAGLMPFAALFAALAPQLPALNLLVACHLVSALWDAVDVERGCVDAAPALFRMALTGAAVVGLLLTMTLLLR